MMELLEAIKTSGKKMTFCLLIHLEILSISGLQKNLSIIIHKL